LVKAVCLVAAGVGVCTQREEKAAGGRLLDEGREKASRECKPEAAALPGRCWFPPVHRSSRATNVGTRLDGLLRTVGLWLLAWVHRPAPSGEGSRGRNATLAGTLVLAHSASKEEAMKEKGNSWTELAVALVSLGLLVALFLLGVGLRGLIQ
jgi:hypothetical protein